GHSKGVVLPDIHRAIQEGGSRISRVSINWNGIAIPADERAAQILRNSRLLHRSNGIESRPVPEKEVRLVRISVEAIEQISVRSVHRHVGLNSDREVVARIAHDKVVFVDELCVEGAADIDL